MPGNELISQLAVSCGSVEEGSRVAQALRNSGVLRVFGEGNAATPHDAPFDPSAVYDIVPTSELPVPQPTPAPPVPSTATVIASPALGRSSLSLSLTRSASRDTDGATTGAGVVRLLASSAIAVGGDRGRAEMTIPTSTSLVAALAQVCRGRRGGLSTRQCLK